MVFGGCRPKNVLSSKKMQEVLYELHRTDAILQCWGMDYGHDEAVAKYYEVTLEKLGVTQALTVRWYGTRTIRHGLIRFIRSCVPVWSKRKRCTIWRFRRIRTGRK